MITEFNIENYKSIQKLSINLGRVNVFIGENGSGKSNILEAITLASAATQDKLDNEFLTSRGVRVTSPKLMRAGFEYDNISLPIKFCFTVNGVGKFEYELFNDNKLYTKWQSKELIISEKYTQNIINQMLSSFSDKKRKELLHILTEENNNKNELLTNLLKERYKQITNRFLKDFLIYSPENTSLRTFEKEGQIEPLGIYGEGLFKLLKYFASNSDKNDINKIKKCLRLFDWFKDFNVPERLFEGENYLRIKDKYLDNKLEYFDQRSSNEGFLFVLFYFSLLISDKTPSFFAIDNIEASLNPKLSTRLIKSIAELAKENEKQIIITTHSASVLDGIDLNNSEHKLYLIYRNKLGHTKIKNINKPQPIDGQEPIKLSEAFLRGYIGGLPKNFSL